MDALLELMDNLKKRLALPLPGLEAQLKMAGMRRIIRQGKVQVPDDFKKAAVLILFYPGDEDVKLVFIRRNEYRGAHSGQISFPGGRYEPEDRDLTETALRETEEEIGINRNKVKIIGLLTDLYIPPSHFLVTPVVGYITERPIFHPDPEEVKGILEVSLKDVLSEETQQVKKITIFHGIRWKVPCFYVNEAVIWGATAMILSELTEVIRTGY
ncbi:MAG: CoA pyrophosphatase [Bacteroidales bacterium]|nr:CoA pyrophosphatase [Bacteroidales bacterium]